MNCTALTAEKSGFTTALCKERLDQTAFLHSQCRHLLTGDFLKTSAGPPPPRLYRRTPDRCIAMA